MKSTVVGLTHACASLHSLRLATLVPMRRKLLQMRLLGSQACGLLVCIIHACASFHSFKHGYLSLQKYSLFGRIFGESSTFSISHVAKLVTNRVSLLNRQADYISSSTRLATNAFARRFAPSNAVAGQPGPLLVIRWLQAEKKNHTFWYGSFF